MNAMGLTCWCFGNHLICCSQTNALYRPYWRWRTTIVWSSMSSILLRMICARADAQSACLWCFGRPVLSMHASKLHSHRHWHSVLNIVSSIYCAGQSTPSDNRTFVLCAVFFSWLWLNETHVSLFVNSQLLLPWMKFLSGMLYSTSEVVGVSVKCTFDGPAAW